MLYLERISGTGLRGHHRGSGLYSNPPKYVIKLKSPTWFLMQPFLPHTDSLCTLHSQPTHPCRRCRTLYSRNHHDEYWNGPGCTEFYIRRILYNPRFPSHISSRRVSPLPSYLLQPANGLPLVVVYLSSSKLSFSASPRGLSSELLSMATAGSQL